MPNTRIPFVFIVDDPPINVSYFLRKQQYDRGILRPSRGGFSLFLDRWQEMAGSRLIPNAFWRKLIAWAQEVGVKGKFSLLPCPAGLGFVDDHVEGYTEEALAELLALVRTEYTRNFDITPEILTHTLAWDVAKGELLPITEHEWMAQQDEETLATYMAKGLEVLRNVGITAPGITQPCSFSGDEGLYARAVLEAEKRVHGLTHTFYFLNTDAEAAPCPSPVTIADPARDEYVVSVVSASKADEPFWATIYGEGEIPEMVDYYLNEDGTRGRFRELAEAGGPIVFHAHSTTLYSNGTEKGFVALQEVIRRVHTHFGDRVQWMKIGDFAEHTIRQWQAEHGADEVLTAGDDLRLIAPDRGLKDEFLCMAEEFRAEGNTRFGDAVDDFETYFMRHEGCVDRARLPKGTVPWTAYWLVQSDGQIVGRSSLRHELNDYLRREGGHIGYAIRPSARRKGYGTRLLALTLLEARTLPLSRVLVTCDASNVGSRRIIERNGGVFESDVVSAESGQRVLRYWIELPEG